MTKCILISAYLCHHAFNFHKIPVNTATRVGITLLDHEIPRSLTSSDGTLGENTDLWRKKLANDVQPDHTICCMGLQSPVMILKKLRLVDSDVFTLFKCIESSTFATEDAELPTGARKCAVFVLGSFHWTGYSINLTNGSGYHFDSIDGSSLDQGRTPTFIEESKDHAIKRTAIRSEWFHARQRPLNQGYIIRLGNIIGSGVDSLHKTAGQVEIATIWLGKENVLPIPKPVNAPAPPIPTQNVRATKKKQQPVNEAPKMTKKASPSPVLPQKDMIKPPQTATIRKSAPPTAPHKEPAPTNVHVDPMIKMNWVMVHQLSHSRSIWTQNPILCPQLKLLLIYCPITLIPPPKT